MKKLSALLALTTLLSASSAQAQWEYNWLLGLSGGYAASDGNVSVTVFSPAPTFDVSSFTRDIDDDGFIGGFFVGYQARCNGWLFGGELALDWEDTDADRPFAGTVFDLTGTAVGISGSAHYDRETILGLTARAGYEISPFIMIYLRAGAEWSRDKLFITAATTGTPALFGSIEGRRTVTRFIGAIGFEMPVPIMTGLSFRAEYNYHSKGSSVEASGITTDGGTIIVADAKPRTNSIKASLVWNFL